MRLLVCGSRHFTDYDYLLQMIAESGWTPAVIIAGGAPGADTLAERYAAEVGLPMDIHRANWARYGRAAGPRRNAEMVAVADAVIAFPLGESRGTRLTIALAKKRRIPVKICEKMAKQEKS